MKMLPLFQSSASFRWSFDGAENIVDYCEDFTRVHKQTGAVLDKDAAAASATGETTRFASSGNASVIYKTEGVQAFEITVYSKVYAAGKLKALTSADGTTWNTVAVKTQNHSGLPAGWQRVSVVNSVHIPQGQLYLKLEFGEDIQVGKVGIYAGRESYTKASYAVEYNRSANMKIAQNAYYVGDRQTASIEIYRYAMRSAAFRMRYKGEQPAVQMRYSVDGNTYKEASAFRTADTSGANGYREFTVLSDGMLPEGTKHVILYVRKPDNGGKDVWIDGVSLCVGNYFDDCETLGEAYAYSSSLKVVKSGGFTGLGASQTDSFVINKNNITGFNLGVRMTAGATIKTASSKDGKTFRDVACKTDDVTKTEGGVTYCSVRNTAAIEADSDYLKITIGNIGGEYVQIDSIYTESVNDPVQELKKISSKKGKKFSDVFSIAHVGQGYTHRAEPSLLEGVHIVEEMGGTSINIWLSGAAPGQYISFSGYPFHSEWEPRLRTVTEFVKTAYMKEAFASKQIKTYILELVTGPDIPNMVYTAPRADFDAYLKAEYDEVYEFCTYLLTTYKNSGKTFICQTWESDWWLNRDGRYTNETLDRFAEIMNMRQKAFDDARAKNAPVGMKLYNCLQVVDLLTAMAGNPCVTTRVLPKTNCDMYAYSAYQTSIPEYNYAQSIETLKNYAPASKLLGKNNLYIGEMGIPEMEFGTDRVYTNLLKGYKTLINNDMLYGVMWQIYCNEPKDRNDVSLINSHDNDDYRGFWLIRADGTKTPIYHVLKMALKN